MRRKKWLKWIFSHRTKILGYGGVTIGVLATSTVIPTEVAGWLLLVNSLMTALVGHYNSYKNHPKGTEATPQ